ncbi:MAG: glutamyl-tRNA reductase [Haloferacaceae archaeon]
MTVGGMITGVSVAQPKASVDDIAAASAEDVQSRLSDLLGQSGVEEAFLLQTCNRTEAYVVTESPERGRAALFEFTEGVSPGVARWLSHEESLRHLMRVASGLESLVLGEDQILGQVRGAYEDASEVGSVRGLLDDAVTKAIHVGERARTETAINEGVLSLGSAAVQLADAEVGVADARAVVVGAGEMGRLAAKALAAADVAHLVVANRTVERAADLATTVPVDAESASLADLPSAVAGADVVITATGSQGYVLTPEDFAGADGAAVVDVAQPRDVDPAVEGVSGISVHDIDALESVTDQTREQRRIAAADVEEMIDRELDRLVESFKRKRADEAISAMYESAERLKQRELETAFSKLEVHGDLTDRQREAVQALADTLVGQLLAAPTRSLREAAAEDDWATIQTAMRLFDPEFGDVSIDGDDTEGQQVVEQSTDG